MLTSYDVNPLTDREYTSDKNDPLSIILFNDTIGQELSLASSLKQHDPPPMSSKRPLERDTHKNQLCKKYPLDSFPSKHTHQFPFTNDSAIGSSLNELFHHCVVVVVYKAKNVYVQMSLLTFALTSVKPVGIAINKMERSSLFSLSDIPIVCWGKSKKYICIYKRRKKK